jgi:hypothetical protein
MLVNMYKNGFSCADSYCVIVDLLWWLGVGDVLLWRQCWLATVSCVGKCALTNLHHR